ncbi:AMP-binding enzyme [Bosea sp. (in: a-proteobacteria)]|uniref:AMP-binding enzyme n=1 Tax=Bosea sp. (in: a-proteobacteria) TaxID=1871050 RepID=UPI0039C86C71
MIGHCRSRLTSYKVPNAIHVVSEIPRTGSGKVQRFKLRQILERESTMQSCWNEWPDRA